MLGIDSLPLRKRGLKHGEAVSLNAGEVMAAVDHSARPTRPILARVRGGKDAESWLDFLVSKTGQPRWVVADGGPEIEYAVGQAWPDAILYRCDEHLRRNARDWALADGIGKWRKTADAPPDMVMVKEEESDAGVWPPKRRRYFEIHPVYAAILTCLGSPAQWSNLKAVVEANVPPSKRRLRTWIADNEALVLQQCELRRRYPGMPISTGQAEAFLEIVRTAFRGRAGRFTNTARLDKVLGLMVLNRAGLARRATYQGLLRAHFLANDGGSGVTNWRRWLDERGASSLDRLMLDADIRQAARDLEMQDRGRIERQEAAVAADADAQLAAGRPLRRGRKRRPDEPARRYFSVKGKMVADTEVGHQWHPTANGDRDPRTTPAGSSDRAMWLCREHEHLGHLHEWEAPVVQRCAMRTGCPWHMNRRVCSGNSLRATHPEIAAEWHPTLNGELTPDAVLSGSPNRVWWTCTRSDGAHPPFPQEVVQRTRQFAGCPVHALEGRRVEGRLREATQKRRSRALAKQARIAGIRTRDGAADPASTFVGEPDQLEGEVIAPLLTSEELAEAGF